MPTVKDDADDMNVKGKYLNPKADLTFKLLFGDDVGPDEYYHHYAVVNVEHTFVVPSQA